MKKYVSLLCLVCAMFGTAIGVKAQNPQLTNHYAMKLVEDGQGGYRLLQEARYAKHVWTLVRLPMYWCHISMNHSD